MEAAYKLNRQLQFIVDIPNGNLVSAPHPHQFLVMPLFGVMPEYFSVIVSLTVQKNYK